MPTIRRPNLSGTAHKVTHRAATLVEAAADSADRRVESAVDRADMAAATTAYNLKRASERTRRAARRNSQTVGLVTMGLGLIAVLGSLAMMGSRAGRRRRAS
jgi:hypothetical protein